MWFYLSIIKEVNFPGKYDTFTLAISFMFTRVSMAGCSSAEELQIHPSASCRFCEKNLKCSGSKFPRVSLFNIVKNKEIVGYSGEESLVLGDIARSLAHELNRDEHLSDVSCLTCAKLLAKTHASISKLSISLPPFWRKLVLPISLCKWNFKYWLCYEILFTDPGGSRTWTSTRCTSSNKVMWSKTLLNLGVFSISPLNT